MCIVFESNESSADLTHISLCRNHIIVYRFITLLYLEVHQTEIRDLTSVLNYNNYIFVDINTVL